MAEEGMKAAAPRDKAMQILTALARIFGAGKFVPIASAQISGVSYLNLSDAGLDFLESFAAGGAKVTVPAMLNPSGMDPDQWREMGIDEAFAGRQKRVIEAYLAMGITPTCTCTPYLAGHAPRRGELLAWGESSAVAYVNSVIGARTNREGGPAALSAAIVGQTPLYGLHLDENRRPAACVRVAAPLRSQADYGALGVALGRKGCTGIPLITSDFEPTAEGLKALSASLPTYTGAAMFHWKHTTPEWEQWKAPAGELTITGEDIEAAFMASRDRGGGVDVVFTGCPHASLEELEAVAAGVSGKGLKLPLWVCASRSVRDEAAGRGHVEAIEKAGGRVLADTCLVVAPLPAGIRGVMTDSAKACYYLRGVHGLSVRLDSLERCLECAMGKRLVLRAPGAPDEGSAGNNTGITNMKTFTLQGRVICEGKARAQAVTCGQPLSFFGGVDPDRGIVVEKGHELEGRSVGGAVLVFPRGKGSTVGSYVLQRMAKNSTSPAAMVLDQCDSVIAVGAVISQIPCVDKVDINLIHCGDEVEINGGEITVYRQGEND
ncbi:MAG: aconitase X [Pseudomonadota bacterium]